MTTGSGGTGAVGDTLNLSGSNHEGDTIFNLTGSPTGKTLLPLDINFLMFDLLAGCLYISKSMAGAI